MISPERPAIARIEHTNLTRNEESIRRDRLARTTLLKKALEAASPGLVAWTASVQSFTVMVRAIRDAEASGETPKKAVA